MFNSLTVDIALSESLICLESILFVTQILPTAHVYHPSGYCSMAFLDQLVSFVSFISSIKQQLIIVGDFNVHADVPGGDGL